MIYHYPVQWPVGWPRNDSYELAQFKVDYDTAVRELFYELERLDAESAYISTDQELRVNGTPRRDRVPDSPAVAVYFVRNGKQLCIPCDKFRTVRDNIRAVGLTLESIRRMERYGTSQTVEATLSGFAALPAEASPNVGPRPWHEVLQVSPDADPSVVRGAYRNLAAKYHPDNPTSGDQSKFLEVQRAFQEANS
jgi:DnaJ domain